MAGQRRGFGGDSLHQVAVGTEGVDTVGKQIRVDLLGQEATAHGHADADSEALSEWTGGRLDARGMAELGVPRSTTAKLPEVPDLLQWQIVAAEV
jgi:hypothetical protein